MIALMRCLEWVNFSRQGNNLATEGLSFKSGRSYDPGGTGSLVPTTDIGSLLGTTTPKP